MASSFRDLKKSRDAMFEALNKQVESAAKKGGAPEEDTRFWYPEVDKAGNGFALIRFLPAAPGEAVPYITEYSHGFKDKGGWYINRCRSTLGRGEVGKDPANEWNMQKWQESKEPQNASRAKDMQKANMKFKRNVSYICNVLVIKDSLKPENEGKVFLFRYGVKIHNMLVEKMKPTFEGETPMNPFDPWEGADFKMKITTNAPIGDQKKGFRNYDKSEFAAPKALGSDDEIEAIWKQEHALQPLIAEDTFKSYEQLEKEFNKAMGFTSTGRTQRAVEEEMEETPVAPPKKPRAAKAPEPEEDSTPPFDVDEDEDDDLARFRALANMED